MQLAEKEITIEIKHLEIILLLIFSIAVLYLELQVTFGTPINFGDEAFHTRLAQLMAENIEYPVYYPFWGTELTKNGFNRVPLWNILEGSFLLIFGFSEIIIRFLTPFVAILTGIATFVLVKKLYNEKVALIASVILMTIPSFVTYSVLFYTDILFTFYFSLFFLVFILAFKTGNKKYWLVSGIFGAFAFLTKTPGIAAYLFVALVFLYELATEKKFLTLFKKYLPLVLIMVAIPSTFFLRSLYYYKTPACFLPLPFFSRDNCSIDNFEEKYQWAGRVEQVGTEMGVFQMGITNYLSFAYGNIWFVVFGFLCGLVIFLSKKEKTDLIILLAFVVLLITAYQGNIFVRAEDTARYALGWAPIIALVAGSYFDEIYNFIKKYQKHVALVVFVVVLYFSFINLKDKLDVMAQVKQFSPLFFEACDWIKQNTPKDALISTVWGWRATYNCQRDIEGIIPDMALSKDLNYTLSVAKQLGITHIFVQKFSIDFRNQHLSEKYDWDFVQFLENNPEHFIKIYENGPPLQQCLQQGGCDGNIVYEIKYR